MCSSKAELDTPHSPSSPSLEFPSDMAPRNPTADKEPDFEDESWEGPRTAIMEGGRTAEEAVGMLGQSWRTKHDRDDTSWTKQMRLEEEAALAAREEQEAAPIPAIELPKQPEKSGQQDWTNLPLTPSFLNIKPARHILKWLEKRSLWNYGTLPRKGAERRPP